MNDLMHTLQNVTVWILPVLFAITLPEAVRGYAALWCGDKTAKLADRLSINPLRHIDPFGTIVLPAIAIVSGVGILFGYPKAVPVNYTAFERPRLGMVVVSAAGPVTNLVLAAVSIFLFSRLPGLLPTAAQLFTLKNLQNSVVINLMLAVFTMLPIPPLAGGRILIAILPRPLAREFAKVEGFGMLIILALLVFLPMLGERLHMNFNVLGSAIQYMVNWIGSILVNLFG